MRYVHRPLVVQVTTSDYLIFSLIPQLLLRKLLQHLQYRLLRGFHY